MIRLVIIGWAIWFAGAAHAQFVYFGLDNPRGTLTHSNVARAAFLARLGMHGTDTLEAYAAFAPDPMLSFPGTGITATTNIDFVAGFAQLAVSGSKLLLDRGDGGDSFTFSAPVGAFGMYVVQAGDGANVNQITVRLENTQLGTARDVVAGTFGPGMAFDSTFFIGVTDRRRFDRVTILESIDANDGTLYDNITVGFLGIPSAVAAPLVVTAPEPGVFVLVAVGASAVPVNRWRAGRLRAVSKP